MRCALASPDRYEGGLNKPTWAVMLVLYVPSVARDLGSSRGRVIGRLSQKACQWEDGIKRLRIFSRCASRW